MTSDKTCHAECAPLMRDPICGNCNKPLSKHYHEDQIFCFVNTNGDLFTDTPPDSWIFNEMVERHGDIYDALVAEWRIANGHVHKELS